MTDGSFAINDLGSPNAKDSDVKAEYPNDHIFRMNHFQALGTHNSYHLLPEIDILPWRYEHLALSQQLEQQGVRQFELDLYQSDQDSIDVYHIDRLDDRSNCETLRICFEEVISWSKNHPLHHPILILLEPKSFIGQPTDFITSLESIIESTWPRDQLLTPQLVQKEHINLKTAIELEGWPTLGETRGKTILILHTGGDLRAAYLNAPGGTQARLMFPDAYGDLEQPFAAYHSINDPIGNFERIQTVVSAGHLVRTRADADNVEPSELNYMRSQFALDSGAHFLSTDHPYPPTDNTYGFVIPDGSPSRCNPLVLNEPCRHTDIEDLSTQSN